MNGLSIMRLDGAKCLSIWRKMMWKNGLTRNDRCWVYESRSATQSYSRHPSAYLTAVRGNLLSLGAKAVQMGTRNTL